LALSNIELKSSNPYLTSLPNSFFIENVYQTCNSSHFGGFIDPEIVKGQMHEHMSQIIYPTGGVTFVIWKDTTKHFFYVVKAEQRETLSPTKIAFELSNEFQQTLLFCCPSKFYHTEQRPQLLISSISTRSWRDDKSLRGSPLTVFEIQPTSGCETSIQLTQSSEPEDPLNQAMDWFGQEYNSLSSLISDDHEMTPSSN